MSNKPLLSFIVLIIINDLLAIDLARVNYYYILHWRTTGAQKPHRFLGRGKKPFLVNKCQYKNCYITKNERYFRNKDNFHAIVFDLVDLTRAPVQDVLPKYRNLKQKYIFTATETDVNYPLCRQYLNDFFNWTWTYRLDSDFRRGFITVYNLEDEIIGPKEGKTWPKAMIPINAEFKHKIKFKTQIAAWIHTDCHIEDNRRQFVRSVQEELFRLDGVTVDIFDGCEPNGEEKNERYGIQIFNNYSQMKCTSNTKCGRMIKRNYLFYFVFETSVAKDYVTEKLMTALDNYSVPVVYGGANYSMFLPPGSYLNARELGPVRLARKMIELRNDREAYYNFFRWRNHFKYRDTSSSDICTLCQMLNEQKCRTVKSDFINWWSEDGCHNI